MMTSCLGSIRTVDQQLSPDGRYKAELGEGDTGAVGGWDSYIAISDVSPSFMTRLLRSDKKTVFDVDVRAEHVKLRWDNDGKLEVTCSRCDSGKVELKESAWKDVRVVYHLD
jgi:hypothetical protein